MHYALAPIFKWNKLNRRTKYLCPNSSAADNASLSYKNGQSPDNKIQLTGETVKLHAKCNSNAVSGVFSFFLSFFSLRCSRCCSQTPSHPKCTWGVVPLYKIKVHIFGINDSELVKEEVNDNKEEEGGDNIDTLNLLGSLQKYCPQVP